MEWQHRCSECRKLLMEGAIENGKLKIVCPRCGTANFFAQQKFFQSAEFSDTLLRAKYPLISKEMALDVAKGAVRIAKEQEKKYGGLVKRMAERAAAFPLKMLCQEAGPLRLPVRDTGRLMEFIPKKVKLFPTRNLRDGDAVWVDAKGRRFALVTQEELAVRRAAHRKSKKTS